MSINLDDLNMVRLDRIKKFVIIAIILRYLMGLSLVKTKNSTDFYSI